MHASTMEPNSPLSASREHWCHCQEHTPHSQVSEIMSDSNIWKSRFKELQVLVINLLVTAIIYACSEVLVWLLSLGLTRIRFQFLSAIFGMASVFITISTVNIFWKRIDAIYQEWLKSKIDFINSHISVAFPIPIVMLNPTNPLGSSDIGRIVGVFVITSAVGWVVTFTFATLFVSLAFLAASSMTKLFQRCYRVKIHQVSDISAPKSCNPNDSLYTASEASKERRSTHTKDSFWSLLVRNWAMLVSFTCIFTVGIPVAARTSDHRAMDGFTLWFLWLGCVKLQGKLKLWAKRSAQTSKLWVILATVANPVLFATLLLTAYTRAKASLMGGPHILDRVLAMLSSGTPLYEILTSATSHVRLPHNQSAWFGAGDLALSALECGIVVWGFKLFECRKQLLSIPGACTILICIMVAVGNVYLSVIVGHAVGLKSSEALAFAARNTTLALAKPAMEAIGGNTVVNAALVVGNGIIGQILYPFVMHKLVNPFAIWCEATTPSQPTISREPSVTNSDGGSQATVYLNPSDNDPHTKDSALTVATGIAVGVNGAAMGVSYLYEHDHPAAPYAVLAMTVYGISTVILTTVDPFKTSAMALAR